MQNNDRFEDPRHIDWAKEVKKRDKFTCQICEATKVYLHSHHKNSYDWCVEQRFDIRNGVTLCSRCHSALHEIYGSGQNTEYQYKEFCKIAKILLTTPIKKQ